MKYDCTSCQFVVAAVELFDMDAGAAFAPLAHAAQYRLGGTLERLRAGLPKFPAGCSALRFIVLNWQTKGSCMLIYLQRTPGSVADTGFTALLVRAGRAENTPLIQSALQHSVSQNVGAEL